MPRRRLLVGVGHLNHRRFVEGLASNLEAHGQAGTVEAARYLHGREAGKVEDMGTRQSRR